MSNEINIKIDISDELLGKLMTVMLASQSPMPMIGAMMPSPKEVEKKDEEKKEENEEKDALARWRHGLPTASTTYPNLVTTIDRWHLQWTTCRN